ncbi:MAG: hypothetical protein ACO3PN_09265, partial [Chthoniobacterales bacterium]
VIGEKGMTVGSGHSRADGETAFPGGPANQAACGNGAERIALAPTARTMALLAGCAMSGKTRRLWD